MRSSVTKATPSRHASAGKWMAAGSPSIRISPAAPAARDAENQLEDFRAARSQEPADSEDFAAPQIEAHAFEHAPPAAAAHRVEGEIAHRKDGSARARRGLTAAHGDVPPDHRGNDRARRKALDCGGQDAPAVAQHGDAVGESKHLIQAVRRVDDRNAPGRELAHHLEQRLTFRSREGGGRLVHDQNPRVERKRLGDLDQLLFPDPELRDAALGVDIDAEAPQERARGLHDAPPVDDGPEDQRFAAKKNIVGRRQLGDEVEFLVDDRDARALGVLHAGETNRRSRKPNRAFVFDMDAGEDFHQSAFAGAVLTHQGVHFAAHQVEVYVVHGLDSGERFGDAFGFQNDGVAA